MVHPLTSLFTAAINGSKAGILAQLRHTVAVVMKMKKQSIKSYLIAIGATLAAGILSGLVTSRGLGAYAQLMKPPLTPPSVVFAIVWTILYLLMGVGAARIYLSANPKKDAALTVYVAQLLVNCLWSFLFFGAQAYLLSFFWLILLLVLIAVMIARFYPIDRTAALLQLPYLLWVLFAGYLNLAVWLLNR